MRVQLTAVEARGEGARATVKPDVARERDRYVRPFGMRLQKQGDFVRRDRLDPVSARVLRQRVENAARADDCVAIPQKRAGFAGQKLRISGPDADQGHSHDVASSFKMRSTSA